MQTIRVALFRIGIAIVLTFVPPSINAEDKEMPSAPEMKLASPGPDEHLTAVAAFGNAEKNRIPVFLKVRIAPGFHIYSLDAKSGSANKPTRFETESSTGVRFPSPWRGPKAKKMSDGSIAYEDEALFWTMMDVNKDAKAGPIKIKMTFQACNELLCWPPETIVRELQFTPEAGRK